MAVGAREELLWLGELGFGPDGREAGGIAWLLVEPGCGPGAGEEWLGDCRDQANATGDSMVGSDEARR